MKKNYIWMAILSIVLGALMFADINLPDWLIGTFLIAIGIVALIK